MNKLHVPRIGHHGKTAFTLVELLVSTALIALLMGLLLGTVSQTQGVMDRTTAKVGQFQASRAAFEAMTRRLSQATLNAYWRAFDSNTGNASADFQYRRASELHFISGPTERFFFSSPAIGSLNSRGCYPTQAVFFQAPLGYAETESYRSLDSLLATCGYFIEFGDDPQRPSVLPRQERLRSRLMELTVPGEQLKIFQRRRESSQKEKNESKPQVLTETESDYVGLVDSSRRRVGSWTRPLWMKPAFERSTGGKLGTTKFTYAHPIAENVIALIVLPKLAVKDRRNADSLDDLAPDFEYDSWRILRKDPKDASNTARDNLLPPIVQVSMVAIDEPSAIRSNYTVDDPPKWTEDLFKNVRNEQGLVSQFEELEKKLSEDPSRINYRIFSTDVVIRASKWSKDPR